MPEPRVRTTEEKSELDSVLDNLVASEGDVKPAVEEVLDENSASTVTMERHANIIPEVEPEPVIRETGPVPAGSPVEHADTVDPWYLISSKGDVVVKAMPVSGDNCIVMTRTNAGVSQIYLQNMRLGACHDSKGRLDGTHEMYSSGNQKPLHLSDIEVRRMMPPRPGLNISG